MESSTPGIYHAAVSVLERIDRIQERFLRNTGLTAMAALMDYRLAPLCSRRDIAMLGVLHKIVLGKAPEPLAALFPVLGSVPEPFGRQRTRYWMPKHDKQLFSEVGIRATDVMRKSLFGLVHMYNSLPQKLVDSPTPRIFQGRLQAALKRYASTGAEDWPRLLSTVWRLMPRRRLHALFD